jgi:hypothetical protein
MASEACCPSTCVPTDLKPLDIRSWARINGPCAKHSNTKSKSYERPGGPRISQREGVRIIHSGWIWTAVARYFTSVE